MHIQRVELSFKGDFFFLLVLPLLSEPTSPLKRMRDTLRRYGNIHIIMEAALYS